jgi:hypothetical protein
MVWREEEDGDYILFKGEWVHEMNIDWLYGENDNGYT